MVIAIQSEQIWVALQPIDFRCGVDGLCIHIQEYFKSQPQAGIYVFYNRSRNRLKLLLWHHNGFMLLYKRLEKGRFPLCFSKERDKVLITEEGLQGLLIGLDWQTITHWQEINFENYY